MEFKAFRNKFDLELIQAAHSAIIPGTMIWEPVLFGAPSFEHKGMPGISPSSEGA